MPGTPEEVWQAIATGPGITSWFVPAEVAGRVGGRMQLTFGPGIASSGEVTAWEPPHRFRYEERDWLGRPERRPRHGVVRRGALGRALRRARRTSLFASAADWDDQLESIEVGWPVFLSLLRLYLTHFPGQRCSSLFVLSETEASADAAWEAVAGGLGLLGAREGESVETAPGVPRMRGIVERADERGIVLRGDEPAPGLMEVFAFDFKGPVLIFVRGYLYGDTGAEAVVREESLWREWLAGRLPGADARAEHPARAG